MFAHWGIITKYIFSITKGREFFCRRVDRVEGTEKRDYGRCAESAALVHKNESRAGIVEHGLLIGVARSICGARSYQG